MKRRAFPSYGPEVDAKYQRAGQWLRAAIFEDAKAATWCAKNGMPLVRAAGEGINSSGGFIVPHDLANAIMDLRESYGAFRRRALIAPMASDSTSAPRRTGGTAATFTAENGTAAETSANVDEMRLTAKKVTALVRVSSELEEDAEVEMVDFLANEMAWAFATVEDDCAFNGDGTSTYGKMRGIGTIVLDGNHGKAKVTGAHNTFATLDSTDIANLMLAVRAAALANSAWFCSQTAFALTFCRLVGAGGGYLESQTVDGVITPIYLGFPVIISAKMPLVTSSLSGKMMMAFGDMYRGGVLGQRRGITIKRSPERYFDSDQIGVLGTQRFHANIHDIGDNNTAGALAALVGS